MRLAQMPPWLREEPVRYARTLRRIEIRRLQDLDNDLKLWDHIAASQANKFDGGKYPMRFADIPKEVVQPVAKPRGPMRLTSLGDGTAVKVISVRTEPFTRTGKHAGEQGTRHLLKSKGGEEFVVSEQMYKQLEAGLIYAAKHGKTDEEKGELFVELGSVTSGKEGHELTRRILK